MTLNRILGCGLPRRGFMQAALGGAALTALSGGASTGQAQELKGTFWFNQPFQMDNFQKIVDRFRAQQKAADLDFVLVPQNQISTKLATAIAGGDIPSAARFGGPELNSLFIDRGQAVELDALDPKIGSYDWIPWIQEAVTRNGKMYAMPVNSGALCFIYNRDLYKAKGLDPDKPPQTLHELAEVAGKISDPGTQTWGHYLLTAPDDQSGGQWFQHILWAFGGEVVSKDGKTITLDSPGGGGRDGVVPSHGPRPEMHAHQAGDGGSGLEGLPHRKGRLDLRLPLGSGAGGERHLQGTDGSPATRAQVRHRAVGFRLHHGLQEFHDLEGRLGVQQVHWPGCGQRRILECDLRSVASALFLPQSPVWQEYEAQTAARPGIPGRAAGRPSSLYWAGASEIASRVSQAIEAVIYGRQTPKEAMDAATKDAQVVLDRALRRRG